MSKESSSLSAFILGGLLGAALGILYAPARGEETRARIKEWSEDQWEDNLDALEEMKERAEKAIAKKKKELGKKVKEVQKEFKDAWKEEKE